MFPFQLKHSTVNYLAKKTQGLLTLLALLLCTSLPIASFAQLMTPADAAEEAKTQVKGKVIKVLDYDQEKKGYSVRMLTPGGQVRTLFIIDKAINTEP